MELDLECVVLEQEERIKHLETSREQLWRALSASLAAWQQDVPEQLAAAVAQVVQTPSGEAVRAEAANLSALVDAVASMRSSGRKEAAPNAGRDGSTQTASLLPPSLSASHDVCGGGKRKEPHAQRQPLHTELLSCEGGSRALAHVHQRGFHSAPALSCAHAWRPRPRPAAPRHAPRPSLSLRLVREHQHHRRRLHSAARPAIPTGIPDPRRVIAAWGRVVSSASNCGSLTRTPRRTGHSRDATGQAKDARQRRRACMRRYGPTASTMVLG